MPFRRLLNVLFPKLLTICIYRIVIYSLMAVSDTKTQIVQKGLDMDNKEQSS